MEVATDRAGGTGEADIPNEHEAVHVTQDNEKPHFTRWRARGGYRELLVLSIPLILSTSSWSLQHFVDRMFLAWYSPFAIAAVMPAGMLNFCTMSIFIGTAGYVSIFAAQYFGAGVNERIGSSIWQGAYIAAFGAIVHLALIPLAPAIFDLAGHDPEVRRYEVIYFQILCLGAFPGIASSAFSGFFTGLGRPWPVMWVNLLATGVNLFLDYLLIFGKWGFPEMGIKGAAIATVAAGFVYCAAYLALLAAPKARRIYHTLSGWRLDRELFARLLRFGFPNGVQFFVDIAGSTVFILLVGRLGTTNLAATNIAFNINTLAFMPMFGFGIAVSVLVGQYIGMERTDLAERSVYSGFHMTFLYMAAISLCYLLAPDIFVAPFMSKADPAAFSEIYPLSVILLRFVALYCIFDTLNIIFASALKGAGDTRFVMYMLAVVSLVVLVLPTYLALVVFDGGLYAAWVIASLYVVVLGFAFFIRFRGGRWKSMRVIEKPVVCLPPILPELAGME
ncbi:MAG TPA: MATE family efflux transporter [Spirochaetota bacterium]|nr:MAG: Multidrug resistance protein MdtK [Spirochaetes bacterium ADurb.BinA120]HPO45731.1 MATE family efflux transporter [Spirochaetota bacterium]